MRTMMLLCIGAVVLATGMPARLLVLGDEC